MLLQGLVHRALHSLLADYLAASSLPFTLSVFQPEAGLTSATQLSQAEVLQALRLDAHPTLLAKLKPSNGMLHHPSCCANLLDSFQAVMFAIPTRLRRAFPHAFSCSWDEHRLVM